jgi:hypothetical protein
VDKSVRLIFGMGKDAKFVFFVSHKGSGGWQGGAYFVPILSGTKSLFNSKNSCLFHFYQGIQIKIYKIAISP